MDEAEKMLDLAEKDDADGKYYFQTICMLIPLGMDKDRSSKEAQLKILEQINRYKSKKYQRD